MPDGPHAKQPVAAAGAALGESPVAVIMVHGRNAGPENILDLVPRLDRPRLSYLAPAAADRAWYPLSFLAPRERNEPWLSSALSALEAVVRTVSERGIPSERIVLLGFSQGACLTAEFAASHARRYGGVVVYSGGLIGPPGSRWSYEGGFDGTPVFLGCSDVDSHVPEARVNESAVEFERMGGVVTRRIYPGMGHLVNDDEIGWTQRMLDAVLASAG